MPSHRARAFVFRSPIFVGLGVALAALSGCGDVGAPDDVQQVMGDVGPATAPPAAAATIAFQTFSDDVGTAAATESRTLIRSARGYQSLFGHAPPAAVDFSREWVMFYAAGTKPTGGYEASFLTVLRAGTSLIAVTQLASPGANCGTTQAFTTPYALIKFAAQAGTAAQFFKQDTTKDCGGPTNLCAAVTCPTGSMCDPSTGKCLSGSVRCGGIAGIQCPGLGKCVDDPSDGCDPAKGGADCGGICSCVENVLCTADSKFDSSPSVCACVPVKPPMCGPVCDIYCQYGNVLDANGCPTCQCNPPPTDPCAAVLCMPGTHCDGGKCVSNGVACGGIAGTPCPGFGKCADDPNDSCDPAKGGADCAGICSCIDIVSCPINTKFDGSPSVCSCVPVVDPCANVTCASGTHCDSGKCVSDGVACGGIAGTPCPGFGKCVDDPNDSCDPARGGADCGGICSCIQTVDCALNTKFDSSPSVCTCVPVVDPCASVKCASGTHCDSGKCVVDPVSCGGLAGKACPGIGKCVDDPSDSCDPAKGALDCPGICSCIQNVACIANSRFDSSPSVCTCVPIAPVTCPPEKCPTPAPKVASMVCADGSVAGPTCAPDASGACGWTITRCPGTPAAN
jgi:hypothetical protein